MAKGINTKKISHSQKLFNLLTIVLVLLVLAWLVISLLTLTKKREYKNISETIQERELVLQENEASPWYKKLMTIKKLEEKNSGMYRFERVEKIYNILEKLRNVDSGIDDDVELSDFNVSLEEVSLRWTVWSLKDLYFTNSSESMKALLESFEGLDFIGKMTIKEYSKSSDDRFGFTLHANVIDNDWK